MLSLRKKIIGSYVIIILITVIIIEIILYTTIRGYYYGNLKDTIYSQIKISAEFYNNYLSSNSVYENIFNNTDVSWGNTQAKVQVIDVTGKVLMDSTGNIPKELVTTKEFHNALNGSIDRNNNVIQFTNNNENIISVAYPLYYDTEINGVLRFMSSTRNIDRSIDGLTNVLVLMGLLVIIISTTVSLFISNSILKPLNVVSTGAEKMAGGNFREKIPKYSEDEIGNLVDTLNYMSEEILKNESLKNEFIASISHELRTPLTSIKGWAIVLNSSRLDDVEEIKDGLKIIEEEAERLTFLVEELLDFSKLISGKISLHKELVNFSEITVNTVKQLTHKFSNKGIDLKLDLEEECEIEIDENRMRQVLINILDNAIKFSSYKGEIRLSLKKEEDILMLIIEDNGQGISGEDLPRIKEKFFKGKNINSSNGIGLSICDEIINLHGGNFEILSEVHQGTKVIITLPL